MGLVQHLSCCFQAGSVLLLASLNGEYTIVDNSTSVALVETSGTDRLGHIKRQLCSCCFLLYEKDLALNKLRV